MNRIIYVLGPAVRDVAKAVTPTTLLKEPLDQLRAADHIVTQVLTKYNLLRSLAQVDAYI